MNLTGRLLRSGKLVTPSNMERSTSLPKPSFSRPRRPNPDYSSRRSQIKLLVLVFALLALLRLMDEARRPENWNWFVGMPQSATENGVGPRSELAKVPAPVLDTRPPAQTAPETPAEPVIRGLDSPPSAAELGQSPQDLAAQNALLSGWSIVWERLANNQQSQLSRGLWTHRQGGPWDDSARLEWPALIDAVRDHWGTYLTRLKQNLEREQSLLTSAQQEQCRTAVALLEQTSEGQLTALRAVVEPTTLDPDQSAALDGLQKVLDERAWKAVEDNTVLRSADNEAWNRAWELVASPDTTTKAELVTFVQLFAQSKVYRGRAVQVQGTARLGYRVNSRSERQEMRGYYVLWLRPADGGDSPLAVYVASLPTGFPTLAERIPPSNGAALHEEVTVTGLYFKRWLYGSQGGPNLAPLLIGNITKWTPRTAYADAEGSPLRSAPAVFLLAIAAMFIACGLIGWMISRRHRRRLGRGLDLHTQESLPNFDATDVRGSVDESLRALHDEANDEA